MANKRVAAQLQVPTLAHGLQGAKQAGVMYHCCLLSSGSLGWQAEAASIAIPTVEPGSHAKPRVSRVRRGLMA